MCVPRIPYSRSLKDEWRYISTCGQDHLTLSGHGYQVAVYVRVLDSGGHELATTNATARRDSLYGTLNDLEIWSTVDRFVIGTSGALSNVSLSV